MSIKNAPVRKTNAKPKAARPQARPSSIDINAIESREQKAAKPEAKKPKQDYPAATPKPKKTLKIYAEKAKNYLKKIVSPNRR